jgi:hypothetical protein
VEQNCGSLGKEAILYIRMTKFVSKAKIDPASPKPSSGTMSPHIHESDENMPGILGEFPFSLVSQFPRGIYVGITPVYKRFCRGIKPNMNDHKQKRRYQLISGRQYQ